MMGYSTIKSAALFMADNIRGDLVVECGVYKNGDLRYKLESGVKYRLNEAGQAVLQRYGFVPRLKANNNQ